jgi:hypothetical protein
MLRIVLLLAALLMSGLPLASRSAQAQTDIAPGSGRLQVAITRGRNLAFWDAPRLELRRGTTVVRRAVGGRALFAAPVPGPQAVLDAAPGVYALRVMLPDGGQFVDIPNLRIAAAETSTMVVEAGAAELSVGWAPQPERGNGARPWPMVRILARGRLLVARPGDPAMFLLLPGDYEVVALSGAQEVARHRLTLAAGDTHAIAIGP